MKPSGFLLTMVLAVLPATFLSPAHAAYTLNLNSGRFPADVTVANANGVKPNVEGYKRGYSLDGWNVDRTDRGYSALSPTYTRSVDEEGHVLPAQASENVLTLPAVRIEAGDFLIWDACSVHPDFLESFRVDVKCDDPAVTPVSETYSDIPHDWKRYTIDLSAFTGKSATVSFTAVSENRYLLALNGVSIGVLPALDLTAVRESPFYFGSACGETPEVVCRVENNGLAVSGKVVLSLDDEDSAETPLRLAHGATERIVFPTSIDKDMEIPVKVYFEDATGARTLLHESSIYYSAFAKNMLVDKATGMWCVNCPSGVLAMENIKKQYGAQLVEVDTHQNDRIANEDYFTALGFRSVPWMIVNRFKSSGNGSGSLFPQFIYRPAKARVRITGISEIGADEIEVKACIETAEALDNSSDRYRLGYVLTTDIYDPDRASYYQENNLNNVTSGQYFFLPSRIPAPLVKFHAVSLTCDHAFSGIEGSIPAECVPGKKYECIWRIMRPSLLSDFKDGRVVAFLLDTQSGEALNTDAVDVDADFSGIDDIVMAEDADNFTGSFGISREGVVKLSLPSGTDCSIKAYTVDGALAGSIEGTADVLSGSRFALPAGFYIFRLESALGSLSAKYLLN